jgi:hypothetical protein
MTPRAEHARERAPVLLVLLGIVCAVALVALVPTLGAAQASSPLQFASVPKDEGRPHDPASPRGGHHGHDTGVFLADPVPLTSLVGGIEPGIAVNPVDPRQIVILPIDAHPLKPTGGGWPNDAPLFFSNDGGHSWTKEFAVPPPPGRFVFNDLIHTACHCNHSIAYGRDGVLYGTFLTDSGDVPCGRPDNGKLNCEVVTGSTTDPTDASAWRWNGDPVQLTNNAKPGSADQPWIAVGPAPRDSSRRYGDLVHVAYDDFAGVPITRVATARATSPLDFTLDSSPGPAPTASNPGLRIAVDSRRGALYALWERAGPAPGTLSYVINRSLDGGRNWALNGSPGGVIIDTVTSHQAPGDSFAGVNAFLAGIDHLAVAPNGDVFLVYGADIPPAGSGDQLLLRRLVTDEDGRRMSVSPPQVVTNAASAALPSVAVADNGTVGVLYDTFDGVYNDGFPVITAHFARTKPNDDGDRDEHHRYWSNARGAHCQSFVDTVLEEFLPRDPPAGPAPRRRDLGDYQQVVAVRNTFYGAFVGNRVPFGGAFSILDPIFFSADARGRSSHAG